jgi:hypothetical protein
MREDSVIYSPGVIKRTLERVKKEIENELPNNDAEYTQALYGQLDVIDTIHALWNGRTFLRKEQFAEFLWKPLQRECEKLSIEEGPEYQEYLRLKKKFVDQS